MKTPRIATIRKAHRRSSGFALVITVALMVLLTMLALGMLTLSQISLRNRQAEAARSEAECNARLALALAIGQLQLSAGPDQRVTAPADNVLDKAPNPHWVGSWKSWRWTPSLSGSAPSSLYTQKAAQFQNWLVSSPTPTSTTNLNFASTSVASDQAVTLVSATRTALATRYPDPALQPVSEVFAPRLPVQYDKHLGGLAWAVFDENTKAPLQSADTVTTSTAAAFEVARRAAPPRIRADILSTDLAPLADATNIQKLGSLGTTELLMDSSKAAEVRGRFHDFTTDSAGLLTNVADGGLRTDLSGLMEASSTSLSMSSALGTDAPYFTASSGAPSWEYLRTHYQQYLDKSRMLDSKTTTGTPQVTPTSAELITSTTGLVDSPTSERLLPVIAKLQIVFSMVSHHAHIPDRVAWLNSDAADPKGNDQHAVPHLAYDPVVTLYNPYDVTLVLQKLRIRIWDPPIGFKMHKIDNRAGTDVYYRSGEATTFNSLGSMCIANETNPTARKYFTLYLTEKSGSDTPGQKITLLPGEVRVFSPWVNQDWTWAWETAGASGYDVHAFFDWNAGADLGNKDGRTGNQFGIETVPGWDGRAGLQTDHQSFGSREPQTLYDFEKKPGAKVGGFLSLRLTDDVKVESQAMRTQPSSSTAPDFMVEVLAGKYNDYSDSLDVKYNSPKDLIRRYKFSFRNVTSEVSEDPTKPIINRRWNNKDLLQELKDNTAGGKSPFAILTMSARTTADKLDDSKAWLYNNPVVEGCDQNTSTVGLVNQSYDLRLVQTSSLTSFPDGIEIDPKTNRGYFGASAHSHSGVTNVPMFHVPVQPASSLGDLIAANLISGSRLPRVTHALGNSRAHPLLSSSAVVRTLSGVTLFDHSYLLNDALWDRYYFSSAVAYSGGMFGATKTRRALLEAFFNGQSRLINPRLLPAPASGSITGTPTQRADTLDGLDATTLSRKMAGELVVDGAFNVNSTSVDAWRAVLSSLRDQTITGWTKTQYTTAKRTPLARMTLPLAGPAETSTGATADVVGQIRWAGFRSLDDGQINSLAQAIVKEIKKRGAADKAPSLTLGEFVNRRLGASTSMQTLAGLLQTAIDNSGVNAAYQATDAKAIVASNIAATRQTGTLTADALSGFTGEGAPSMVTQGDLMQGLATVATVRGDTFKIRACGEANVDGKVVSRVWCEAVVQRVSGYVDPTDTADTKLASLKSNANKLAGRRFVVKSFRWLNPDEV